MQIVSNRSEISKPKIYFFGNLKTLNRQKNNQKRFQPQKTNIKNNNQSNCTNKRVLTLTNIEDIQDNKDFYILKKQNQTTKYSSYNVSRLSATRCISHKKETQDKYKDKFRGDKKNEIQILKIKLQNLKKKRKIIEEQILGYKELFQTLQNNTQQIVQQNQKILQQNIKMNAMIKTLKRQKKCKIFGHLIDFQKQYNQNINQNKSDNLTKQNDILLKYITLPTMANSQQQTFEDTVKTESTVNKKNKQIKYLLKKVVPTQIN